MTNESSDSVIKRSRTDRIIHAISLSGGERGERLDEFCKTYGIMGMKDATDQQLLEFVKEKGISYESD